jgi:hypothetical protein
VLTVSGGGTSAQVIVLAERFAAPFICGLPGYGTHADESNAKEAHP